MTLAQLQQFTAYAYTPTAEQLQQLGLRMGLYQVHVR